MSSSYVGTPPPRKPASPWLWILGIGAAVMALLLAVVVAFVAWGWSLFVAQAQEALQRDPAIVEHIGTIRSLDLDLMATGDADGVDEFVFDVEGDRGHGRVLAELVSTDDNSEVLASGHLTLADGRELPIGEPVDTEVE